MKSILTENARRTGKLIGSHILLLLIFLHGATAYSQTDGDTKPEPPPGPLLAPAPDFSMWVVTFTYSQEQAQAKGASVPSGTTTGAETRTRTVTTTRTGDIIHEEFISATGQKIDKWHAGEAQYDYLPAAKLWLNPGPKDSTGYDPLPDSGFRDLDWISRNHYVGVVPYSGHKCLLFALGSTRNLSLTDPENQVDTFNSLQAFALIDLETRLPVFVRNKSVARSYHFLAAPTEKLSLPPDLVSGLKQRDAIANRLNQPPPRPY